MEEYFQKATKYSPKIHFIPSEGTLEIIGFSLPENVTDLYLPVLEWLDAFEKEATNDRALKEKQYKLNIKLSYFNSGSLRSIVDILKKVNSLYLSGMDICVNWFYENGDIQIKESGNELAELVNIPFHVVESD